MLGGGEGERVIQGVVVEVMKVAYPLANIALKVLFNACTFQALNWQSNKMLQRMCPVFRR